MTTTTVTNSTPLSATAQSILLVLASNDRLGKQLCQEQPNAVNELRERNLITENNTLVAVSNSSYDSMFEEFWVMYPSGPKGYYPKDRKPKCRSMYIEKLKKGIINHEQMMTFMRNYVRYREHLESLRLTNPNVFLPNPKYTSTFLNNIESILEQYSEFLDPQYDPTGAGPARVTGPKPIFI